LSQADDCLIHTGSKEILDGICLQLHLDTDSMKVNKSYAVLENYGNLSSASTEFMLAGKKEWADSAMVIGFGTAPTRTIARNHSSPAARHSDEATMQSRAFRVGSTWAKQRLPRRPAFTARECVDG
jgi:hypothetical protein